MAGPRILAAMVLAGLASQTTVRAPFPRTAARLGIAVFSFDAEIDRFYSSEEPRLAALCQGKPDFQKCRESNLRPFDKLLAVVRSKPSERGAPLGELHAVLGFHPQYDLGYRIDFIPADPTAPRRVWLDSAGDWGYGIHVSGARAVGDWIQLFDRSLPRESWIRADASSFRGAVSGIEGSLVSLPQISARYPDGSRRRAPAGSYFVTSVRRGVVTLRQEIETDMSCGDDIKPPTVVPPVLRVDAASFFDVEGSPLFSLTYPRGC